MFLSPGSRAKSGLVSPIPAMRLLNTLIAVNSSTLGDLKSLTEIFSVYEIILENILPASNNTTLEFQVHSGGVFQTTSYLCSNAAVQGAVNISNPTTFIQLSAATSVQNSGSGFSGFLRIHTPYRTSAPKNIVGEGMHFDGTRVPTTIFSGYWNSSGIIDGFQILFNSGNIASGTVKVFGIL